MDLMTVYRNAIRAIEREMRKDIPSSLKLAHVDSILEFARDARDAAANVARCKGE